MHIDHIKPKSRGGTDSPRNLATACNICNAVKGHATLAEARIRLLQERYGWPRLNKRQLAWLRAKGFDLSELDNGKLAFEDR